MIIAAFWIAVFGAGVLAVFQRRRDGAHAIAPIAEAGDAAIVHLRGKVVTEPELYAPLSRRSCTYYCVVVVVSQFNKRRRWQFRDARSLSPQPSRRAVITRHSAPVPAPTAIPGSIHRDWHEAPRSTRRRVE